MTDEQATEAVRARYAAASPGRLANLARDWTQVIGREDYPEAAERLELIRAAQIGGVPVGTPAARGVIR
ncbi:hypothetical protein VA596_41790 [Amycolatopsis sp., V23-08]|uniref:Uncharacterized protein n=1 Tax=Amycolatopsis heterodermiae TaxID=3110235 RepID=A0ABU5RIK0_9PSEU|nr:hypothetical protein [Amycolatopsis sp., V23-08]MEA5366120.1 hypothetical protein [Amycolatopsis sp., V23-08]